MIFPLRSYKKRVIGIPYNPYLINLPYQMDNRNGYYSLSGFQSDVPKNIFARL